MEQLSCEWCGQKASSEYPVWGHKETVNSPYVVSHQTHGYCIMAALARAEAAEHQLGEVREGLADARRVAAMERERVRALEIELKNKT